MRAFLPTLFVASTLVPFLACSDSASNPTVEGSADAQPGNDATTIVPDAGSKEDAGKPVDASVNDSSTMTGDAGRDGAAVDPRAINGCTVAAYVDQTANTAVDITWGFGTTPAGGSCITVKAGSAVRWNGSLAFHPLAAKDGTAATPIVGATSGDSVTYTFTNVGTYGYVCSAHASMTGAINVVP
jgi:plastocyanin